jgi:phosphate transport system permease protein
MSKQISERITAGLKKRHRQENRFRNIGICAIIFSLLFLLTLLVSIVGKGYSAFFTHQVYLKVDLSRSALKIDEQSEINNKILRKIKYRKIIKNALNKLSQEDNVDYKFHPKFLLSRFAASDLKKIIKNNTEIIGAKHKVWLSASSNVDMYLKGKISSGEIIDDEQISWINHLKNQNKIKKIFNWPFFKNADSREPERAGMAASILGSFFTMIIFLLCAFPIGVMSALYLEEFAPKNIITDIVEISINNLAAIPSIIFGLLGLVIYLNFFSLPRSSAIVGGLTLALMVLPIIIIATRNSIRSIPSSIKDAAVALGASKVQVTLHHILPLALPGIMTGTILAISRAIGETAPLLMIGMVAFIADVPENFTDPTTVMPVQIYLWSDSPELGFVEKTAAAIIILLTFLIIFNGIAVYLRKKLERKW